MSTVRHLWSVLARQALIDSDTNTITISEVLEDLRIDIELKNNPIMKEYDPQKVNSFPMNFEFVSAFYRPTRGKPQSVSSEIEVVDPDGRILGSFENPVEFQAEHYRMRSRAKFDTMGITKSGQYSFKQYLNITGKKRELVGDIPLNVVLYVDGEEVA